MRIGRVSDGSIYHYTRASTFMNYIVPYGELKLSPYSNSMDPREQHPSYFGIAYKEEAGEAQISESLTLAVEASDNLRDRAQMLCFSNSYEPLFPGLQWDWDGDRGWAQSAMWTHFSERHTGVCLEFNKERLLHDIREEVGSSSRLLSGDVVYIGSGDQPISVPNIYIQNPSDISADSVFSHAIHNSISSFFRKDRCWNYEQEFRVVAINRCGEPVYFPITGSLERVILGAQFPIDLRPAVEWELQRRGLDVPIDVMTWPLGNATSGLVNLSPGSSTSDSTRVASLSATPSDRHIHTEDCHPDDNFETPAEMMLGSWRQTLFEWYGRRIERSLNEVSQELHLMFSARRHFVSFQPEGCSIPLSMNECLVYDAFSGKILQFLYCPPSQFADFPEECRVYLHVSSTDGLEETRAYEVSDEASDEEILRIFEKCDGMINDSLRRITPWRVPK